MTIVVVGAGGKLGGRIERALIGNGAEVRGLVRRGTSSSRMDALRGTGTEVVEIDLNAVDEVRAACRGAGCVVSALLGLREVMVATQTVLLDGAMKASRRDLHRG